MPAQDEKCAQSSTSNLILHVDVHCTVLDSLDLITVPRRKPSWETGKRHSVCVCVGGGGYFMVPLPETMFCVCVYVCVCMCVCVCVCGNLGVVKYQYFLLPGFSPFPVHTVLVHILTRVWRGQQISTRWRISKST